MSVSYRLSPPAAASPAEPPWFRPRRPAHAAWALVVTLALTLALPGTARAGVDHWTRPAAAPPDFAGLAVDPCRPDVVYGVSRGEGVFVSHDLGRTWVAVRNGLISAGPPLAAVPACEPGRAAPLWSLGGYPASRSEDGGGSWTPAWDVPGLATGGLGSLAVAPALPRVVYADAGGSIVRSEDGGHTWATIFPDFYVTAVAVSPDDSDRVYALWEPEVGGPRLLVSRDGGRDPAGWEERPTPWTGRPGPWPIDELAVAPGDPDRLWLIGADDDGRVLWTSADGGTTWRRFDAVPFRAPRLLAFDLTVAGRFLVASDDGLFETRDGGATWRNRSLHRRRPLPAGAIAGVQVDPRRPSRLWVSVEGEGIFLHRGRGWEARSGRPVPPFELLAADPRGPDRLWAVGADPSPRLWRSTDGGARWSDAGPVPASRRYFDLHVDRSDGATLLLATAEALHRRTPGGPWQAVEVRGWNDDFPRLEQEVAPAGSPATLYAGAGAHVWESTDGGATWQDHLLPTGSVLALCPGWQPGELVVLTSHTVWRTGDRGASWHSAGVLSNHRVTAPAVADPTRPGTLHAATEAGLWTSRDHGATWSATPLPVPLGTVESLVVTPTDPGGTLYVSADREVWRSRDAGVTWAAAGAGLFGVPLLVPDPTDPAHLLALSWNGLLDARFVDAPPVYLGGGGRFRVSAAWYDGSGPGTTGRATAAPGWRLGDEGTVFRFAGPANPEVAVKLLDGRGVNDHFWWFATSLTHRRHEVTVVDRASGVVATRIASSLDAPATEDLQGFPAFPGLGDAPPPTATPSTAAGSDALSLAGGRFRLELLWRDQAGASGTARAVHSGDGWGHFEIFQGGRMELVVKVLDGRPVNGAYWLFAGPLTHLELWLVVTDTETGERRVYRWGLGERSTLVDLDLPG